MKRKIIHLNKITKSGQIITNQCPACEGDGVDIFDYTHARGGDISVRECGLCEGTGRAIEGIDYKTTIHLYDGTEYIDFDKISKGDNNAEK